MNAINKQIWSVAIILILVAVGVVYYQKAEAEEEQKLTIDIPARYCTDVILGALESAIDTEPSFGGVTQGVPTYTTSTSSAITVTASGDVQAVATSSRRAGVIISNPTDTPVWINLNNDIAATSGQGIAVAATTSPLIIDRDLLYVGGIRATADTEVSISVVEFTD